MRALLRRMFDSFWRIGWPADEKSALKAVLSSLFLHIHAPKVRPASLKFKATWTLGLVSVVLLAALTATGVYLMFYYSPHPSAAYRSMKDLAFVVPFGRVTRNLHRWGAHAMVFLVTLHMFRVYLSAGHRAPREANWVAGVGLWVLTLALSFTGYLLPWDQLAFWAVTVGANMVGSIPLIGGHLRVLLLGDSMVGESALLRFYVLHCVLLPVVILGLVSFHLFRIRKDGGLVVAENEPHAGERPRMIPAWPHLLYRESIVTLLTLVVLMAASLWLEAPLEQEADPGRTPNPAKAPWYFLGVQELAHFSAFWGGVFIPAAVVVGFAMLPYLDRGTAGTGRYFPKERWVACVLFTAVMVFLGVETLVGTFLRGPGWALQWTFP